MYKKRPVGFNMMELLWLIFTNIPKSQKEKTSLHNIDKQKTTFKLKVVFYYIEMNKLQFLVFDFLYNFRI